MTNTTNKKNAKRLPKGKRTHIRRMKQEAAAAGVVYKPQVEVQY